MKALSDLRFEGEVGTQALDDLCSRPTAPVDYLALIAEHDRWVISDVPTLRAVNHETAQRFTNLVDVLYDREVQTVFLSDFTAEDVTRCGTSTSVDLDRTSSRVQQLRRLSR